MSRPIGTIGEYTLPDFIDREALMMDGGQLYFQLTPADTSGGESEFLSQFQGQVVFTQDGQSWRVEAVPSGSITTYRLLNTQTNQRLSGSQMRGLTFVDNLEQGHIIGNVSGGDYPLTSRSLSEGALARFFGVSGGTTAAAGRTQFESERQLDIASATATLQNAQAALQNAQTSQDQLEIQRRQLDVQKAQLEFDKASTADLLALDRDRLNAEIAATRQRLDEIKLEADLAFKNEDRLLTKRLEAEQEMLQLRLDNDMRTLIATETGAERRALISEQGETRRLAASLQGIDPSRQQALLTGQATRGRTPAQLFSQQNQAFLQQPLPTVDLSAPIQQLQQQFLQNQQQRPQAPIAPPQLAPVGLARGGVIEMKKGPGGAFSSYLVGDGAGIIPGVTEVLTVGDGKVTVTPLRGAFQEGGTVTTQPALIRIAGRPEVYWWDSSLGTYRWVLSRTLFGDSGLTINDVVDVDEQTFAAMNVSLGGPPVTEPITAEGTADFPQLIRFGTEPEVYYYDQEAGAYRWVRGRELFADIGLTIDDVVSINPLAKDFLSFGEDITEPIQPTPTPAPTPPPPAPVPAPVPVGPSPDVLNALQRISPAFQGLAEFVPRTQTGPFGGTQAMRDFFSFGGQNLVQDPFTGEFRPFLPGLPEGVSPQSLLNAPTSFGAPVVNQGAFNLQNLASLGIDPALLRLGGQEDIFYRDPATGELRQFGTPDIFEQSGFDPADVFNISPTGQNFQFGAPITSPLPLPVDGGGGAFSIPLIDPNTGALLADPRKFASQLQQFQLNQPTTFSNILSAYSLAGLQPEAFINRFQGATPTGALANPQRIGFLGSTL